MTDLSTKYLGLTLKNPLIVSASPLTAYVDNLQRMEIAGAAAVVLPSLFEEQIELQGMGVEKVTPLNQQNLPDALQHLPEMKGYNRGANGYLAHIYQAKKAVSIPVIASLNGYYSGGWVQYARLIEAAGADAMELNIYYLATKPNISGQEIEEMYLHLVRDVKTAVKIPVAVKLSPYFSAFSHMANQLVEMGADGLVLFNRFYQPDFDLETRQVISSLDLSTRSELRLRLRWAAILSSLVKADLAITGGVERGEDIVKCMMAGAKVTAVASVLLKNGIEYIKEILAGLEQWLEQNEEDSIVGIQGVMSQKHVSDPAAFERANYMNVLKSLEE
ncbi:MAG: dihydroorotate dehydrogenase-like protein [Ardenticatenaceae bacterium]|nr:dihydroorotate dehydrogenase-like protein [Anaerolineales bacterium]MCB9007996.1 dihydroorotate dehydrogenase-like protein [Ardenticatenaceae bacterium]